MLIKKILNSFWIFLKRKYHLGETYIPATLEELQKLEDQAIKYKEKGNFRLYDNLHNSIWKTKYSYLSGNCWVEQMSLYAIIKFLFGIR
jgi:hypothetical protein